MVVSVCLGYLYIFAGVRTYQLADCAERMRHDRALDREADARVKSETIARLKTASYASITSSEAFISKIMHSYYFVLSVDRYVTPR